MATDYCYWGICFFPLDASAPKFFGFSEFLTALALMVLAWTIADVSYRFRIQTAPIPLQGITFYVVAAVGFLTLLTDLWRAEEWLVPEGNMITPAIWQAGLGLVLFLTFLTWTWIAFIRPPVYGPRNAKRYGQALYRAILRSSPSELSLIADELVRSVKSLVGYATDMSTLRYGRVQEQGSAESSEKPPEVTAYADDILLLIADKRFCREIVSSSSHTALAFFDQVRKTKKYGIQIKVFARNIVSEALHNNDSFLFHETEGYESGLIGYHRPLSQAMFTNYEMVEEIGTLLDPDIVGHLSWDSAQWKAYCRAVLMVIRDYVEHGPGVWNHSFVLYRAMDYIERAVFDLYKINGVADIALDADVHKRLQIVVKFIKDAIEILETKGVPRGLPLRVRDKLRGHLTFYDHLASLIFEIIFNASAVKAPARLCWWVQHNSVWVELFNFGKLNGPAAKVVKSKVRRNLYDEIVEMKRFPNFKGAKILGFCLNVMGFKVGKEDYYQDSRALQKAALRWTKRNYVWLHSHNPSVAEECLVDGITYDAERSRLVKTYPAEGLRREPEYEYFDLDPPSPEPSSKSLQPDPGKTGAG